MTRASVVLPVPGGPQRMTELRRSASTSARNGRPGAKQMGLPDDLIERRRAETISERRLLAKLFLQVRFEEVVVVAAAFRGYGSVPSVLPLYRRRQVTQVEFVERLVFDRGGRARQQVETGLRLRERDDLTNVFLAGQDRDEAVEAEREARHGAVRRT